MTRDHVADSGAAGADVRATSSAQGGRAIGGPAIGRRPCAVARRKQAHDSGVAVTMRGPELPLLLTVDETAKILRSTRGAVYIMASREQLPGVTRIGRRLLVRSDALLDWLDQKRAPSLGGER